MRALLEVWLVFHRSVQIVIRRRAWVAISMVQPLSFLLLFGPLLRPLARTPGLDATSPYNVYVPGLLVQLALFSTSSAGLGLLTDIRSGVIERLRVTPVSRAALLLGRILRAIALMVVQAAVLVVCALPLGLRVDALGLAVVFGLIVLVGLTVAPASYALALWLRDAEVMGPVLNTMTLPLMLLSGVLLPLSLAPVWLRAIAALNPLSHAVDASRAVFAGRPGDPAVVRAVAILVVLAALALTLATRSFRSLQS
jgi:ABC-2 type transport system permease protein